MTKNRCMALAAIGAGTFAAGLNSARGEILTFHTFENAGSAPTAGLNLTVELVEQGSALHMVFANQSAIPSVITALYLEQTPSSTALLANPLLVQPFQPGVMFVSSASPANPPGSLAAFGGPWQGTWASFSADEPSAAHGIGPGESVTVRLDLLGTPAQVSSAIAAGDIRIAQHVQALAGGESIWTIAIPAPGALLLLAFAGVARRRR